MTEQEVRKALEEAKGKRVRLVWSEEFPKEEWPLLRKTVSYLKIENISAIEILEKE